MTTSAKDRPSQTTDAAANRWPFESVFVCVSAAAIAVSGIAYVDISPSGVTNDDLSRAIVTIALSIPFALRVLTMVPIKLPPGASLIFAPVVYMSLITVARLDGTAGLGAAARWVFYGLVFAYFSRLRSLRLATMFVATSALVHLSWLAIDLRLGLHIEINGADRVAGSVGSPVGFAVVLFTCSIGLLALSLARPGRLLRPLSVVCGIGMFATGTRSLVVAGGLVLVLFGWYALKNRTVRFVAVVVSPFLALFAVNWILADTQVGQRLLLLDRAGADSSWGARQYILAVVERDFGGFDQLTGLGLGRFPEWFESRTGLVDVAPHFEAIWVYTEGGIVGTAIALICWTGLLVMYTRIAVNAHRSRRLAWATVIMLSLPMTVFQLANPSFFYQAMVVYFGTLATVMCRLEEEVDESP